MGILDNIVGSLLGGSNNQTQQGGMPGAGNSGLAGVLSGLLGGGQSGGMGGAGGGGLGGLGGAMGGLGGAMGAGGLGGLVSQFEQAGFGNVVQSWIGNGANSPISPQQLQNVFGDKIPGMAQQAGMNQGDFLSQLSQHLPGMVDNATSSGQVQSDGSVNV